MTTFKNSLMAVALSLAAATAGAHEGHHTKQSSNKLTGEVIDITCFLDHDSMGEKHAQCARKCIESGMPVGLLVEGKVYNVIVSGHEAPNAKLAPYAGQIVTITGKVISKGGIRAIDMESVEPAPATSAKP